jgi:phenylpropionate dioxygenase-like ring-hydroxylating dioxygenase large terminal subunit
MYPFSEDVFAARNQWYIAAFSRDVGRENLLERWILDEPVVFYRTEVGKAVALEGRCAHRHFPLSQSKLQGDNIECGYHGFTYGPDGACVRIPAQEKIPAACRIKAYPLVERWDWLWIWMGDAALADESTIPNHREIGLTDPEYVSNVVVYNEVACRYQLLHDNLLDLTHISILHSKTIGNGSDSVASTPETHAEGDNWAESTRVIKNFPCPEVFTPFLNYKGLIDRTITLKFLMPGLHCGMDEFRKPSVGDTPGELLGRLAIFHGVTPGRRHTTHYHFAIARDFAKDEATTGIFNHAMGAVIEEDKIGITAIEEMIVALGDRRPREVLALSDSHQTRSRRIFEKLIKNEQNAARVVPIVPAVVNPGA